LADGGNAQGDAVVAAHRCDGLLDVGSVVRGEVVQVGGDAIDEPADPGDLFGRWGCLGSGPVVDIGAVRRFSLLRSRSSR
jgi:hypothetical protein